MRKRNIAILFRLNRKEAEALDKRVKKSGLSREAYLRQLINGLVPRNAPPPDYYSMMRELHQIGNNLNQIAQKAHVLNVIDVQRYDREVRKFRQAVEQITEAVVLPEKIGNQREESARKQSESGDRKWQ
ncbi:plasmid mobilization protein [Mediterraneibacter glycyrrhizinilyticus]|uniref:plasmid mobilization protein n=1 Tax=Mediterraneibacter glycyrrhizinilyticus TaxID=342942 RepID=UPI0025AB3D76|nr:plasmid mobilization relaxosome protein MobC [Mediterraneibacter glycyrrhizinilyticus]MDN0042788.1 plasmid mobilization relaxosome protein MobC [Mediterraneibacter glycyrrhizinilyticus]